MKKIIYLLLIAGICLVSGCKDYVDEYVTYQINEPVFMSASEFRSSVDVVAPKPVEQQGKIAFYEGYLYISQPGKGIHVIDNRRPSAPQNIAFIELPGNADMHVRNKLLYADSHIDLVWFDVSNPAKPALKGRKEEVFPQALPAIENQYGYDYTKASDKSKGIVVGWKLTERKELVRIQKDPWWSWGNKEGVYNDAAFNGGGTGKVGSMSRFAIYKDNLYSVINNQMSIFDLTGETPTEISEKIYVGWDVETIFSYKDNMFMGTPTGMIIYSVADPAKPEYQSRITHFFGCDPVVVENDIAYVTVRSGNFCGQNTNELMVINVEDVKHPKHMVTFNMKGPKGLGIDNGTLFVCDDGLKVFDATNPEVLNAHQIAHMKDMDGLDVIAFNNVLMMIAENGIYQYDYSDVKNIKQLSYLPIGK